jgi:hypothetical protein
MSFSVGIKGMSFPVEPDEHPEMTKTIINRSNGIFPGLFCRIPKFHGVVKLLLAQSGLAFTMTNTWVAVTCKEPLAQEHPVPLLTTILNSKVRVTVLPGRLPNAGGSVSVTVSFPGQGSLLEPQEALKLGAVDAFWVMSVQTSAAIPEA